MIIRRNGYKYNIQLHGVYNFYGEDIEIISGYSGSF